MDSKNDVPRTDQYNSDLSFQHLCKFRTVDCLKKFNHLWKDCDFCHSVVLRRDPTSYLYSPKMCSFFNYTNATAINKKCPKGINCEFAHSKEEMNYHPLRYNLVQCRPVKTGGTCERVYCAYWHSSETRASCPPLVEFIILAALGPERLAETSSDTDEEGDSWERLSVEDAMYQISSEDVMTCLRAPANAYALEWCEAAIIKFGLKDAVKSLGDEVTFADLLNDFYRARGIPEEPGKSHESAPVDAASPMDSESLAGISPAAPAAGDEALSAPSPPMMPFPAHYLSSTAALGPLGPPSAYWDSVPFPPMRHDMLVPPAMGDQLFDLGAPSGVDARRASNTSFMGDYDLINQLPGMPSLPPYPVTDGLQRRGSTQPPHSALPSAGSGYSPSQSTYVPPMMEYRRGSLPMPVDPMVYPPMVYYPYR